MNSVGPLSDLLVLEGADDVAGAFAGKCLAGLGARVIKLEPRGGDPLRKVGPFSGGEPHSERSALFLWLNTNKESVELDRSSIAGRGLLRQLLGRADILIASPAVALLEELGVTTESLSGRYPKLVVGAISPFGLTGPYSAWTADDLVLSAMTGWMHMSGQPDREPLSTFETLPSAVAGLAAVSGVLAAIAERSQSGTGQVIDISAQEVLALCTPYIVLGHSYTGVERRRSGMPFPMTIVGASDGYLGINVLTQAQWEALCSFTGMTDLLDDPDFSTPLARAGHAADLTGRFADWAAKKMKEEVFREGQQWRVPFGFVPTISEILGLETHVAREFFQSLSHPEADSGLYPGMPFKMRGLPGLSRAPMLDEQTDATSDGLQRTSQRPLEVRE